MSTNVNLKELAELLRAEVDGDGLLVIRGAAGVDEAREGDITFITGKERISHLERSRASAAIIPLDAPSLSLPHIRVKNPRLAFAQVLKFLYVHPAPPSGVSDRASIGKNVTTGMDCSIHQFSVLADNVRLGDRVTIHPGVYVGNGSTVGDDSVIYPNVSIGHAVTVGKRVIIHSGTVIGSDGFGFVTEGGVHHKIPQVGGVVIGDDVEIGSNCSVDRAMLGNTKIGSGTKLDNLVHIAHNVTIGQHCLIAGQVGIAGSSKLGNYVVLAGQVGVADHITLGDQVMAGGGTGITRSVDAGQVVAGYHAMPLRDWLKVQVILPKLPELKKLVTRLEKQLLDSKDDNT